MKDRWGYEKTFRTKSNKLDDSMVEILNQCMDEDDIGFFYRIQDGDPTLQNDDDYTFIFDDTEYGVVNDFTIMQ